ncbi:glycosyltransferase family 2 protein [Nocardioides speluncae]|uniref:glycosyltransferase family 2 protein n=1 Tax=Nocardioides speluncae TaxID=2670337 RepID=UPI00137A0002|nr:glycosyltransferase family 2 protein [Nocardioides speluncae]
MTVTVLLVSHDGARWLPAVLKGLQEQRLPPNHIVAVDTGSRDESPELLAAAIGEHNVVRLDNSTSFPAAVRRGLAVAPDSEWIWILHDDSNPDPGALEALIAVAELDPDTDILGPKLREWPSLRRLLEQGVTMSPTGRRETGLERGEYDQGQHNEIKPVLAVNTAGMLVRRAVLEKLGGFDVRLPMFGNDIDFGWRAARAGHQTMIVPDAIVFHAEAAHSGNRRTPLTNHRHYAERNAALYTVLANVEKRELPWRAIRLFFGSLLRAFGFVLSRSPGQAFDELAALGHTYSRFGTILAGRRARARVHGPNPVDVMPLLSPWWLPYRHGLDFVGDIAAAATNQAQDVAERRRAARQEAAAPAPSRSTGRRVADARIGGDDDEDAPVDTGFVARLFTNPIALVMIGFIAISLWACRAAFGGDLSGGALSPVPDGAGDLWKLYGESWHPLGPGTDVPAPAYLLPMALLSTLLFGKTGAALTVVLAFAVPVATWGAWRLLRVFGHVMDPAGSSRWVLAWGSMTYGLVPLVSGAWGQGRLGTVVAAALLPWLLHAALTFADPAADRRWRAAWRTGLLLAVITAFAPVAWVVTLLVVLALVGVGWFVAPGVARDKSVWGPMLTAVWVVPLLLLPWFVPMLIGGHGAALLMESGRQPSATPDSFDLLTGRLGEPSAPWRLGALLGVGALLALVRRASRIPVVVTWLVAAVAAAVALLLSLITLDLAGVSSKPGLAFLVVVLAACAVVAVCLAATPAPWARSRPAWQRLIGGVAVVAASVVPLGGLAWLIAGPDDLLVHDADADVPAYMAQSAEVGDARGVLVVRGSVEDGLTYTIRRGDGITLGDDEILALTDENPALTAHIRELVSAPSQKSVAAMTAEGIEYVVLPAPADGRVAATLDAAAGVTQASADEPGTRAWKLDEVPPDDAVDGPSSVVRALLLIIQGIAIFSVAVLGGPTIGRSSSQPRGSDH